MKSIGIDCTAGAAGDMLLGAALDLLAGYSGRDSLAYDEEFEPVELAAWNEQIKNLLSREEGKRFSLRRVRRAGLSALKIDFYVSGVHADHHASPHGAATLAGVSKIVEKQHTNGGLSTAAAELSLKIFHVLAQAEAKAHRTLPEKVHFHEVGAFDSVMDVLGFSAAFAELAPDEVAATPVTLGSGTVRTAHGVLDVPPPAVREIVEHFSLPITGIMLEGERLTPTGAAILAAVVNHWNCAVSAEGAAAIGKGAGNREDTLRPNLVSMYLHRS